MAVTVPQPSGEPPRPPAPAVGVILVLVSAAAFGSGALLVQPLYEAGMAALTVLFWRFGLAAFASWAYLLAFRRTRASLRALPRRRVGVLALLGALYVGNSYAFFASLQVVPISLASIISYLYPVFVAVLAIRLVRRLQGPRAWLALGISMLGVALAVGGAPEGSLPPLWGLALAFATPFIYAIWIIFQARLTGDRPTRAAIPPGDAETVSHVPDPAAAGAMMTTATALVYAVLALGSGAPIFPSAIPGVAWLPLLGLGLVATALAIQTFYAGVKRVGAARASLISTVEPVYTIALAVILFGERLTQIQVAGGVLVLLAVVLAETGRDDNGETGTDSPDRVGLAEARQRDG
jgi:drug/metabolite transporter (DMT)-like permease